VFSSVSLTGNAVAQPAVAAAAAKVKAKKERAQSDAAKDGVAPVETQEPVAVVAASQLEKWIQDI
jgi:hypothetical protein